MTDTINAPAPQPLQQSNGKAKASLVFGIVSLFINPLAIATILGIVFGVLGVRQARVLGGRNKAIVGIVLSVVGFFVGIIVFVSILSGISGAANKAITENPVSTPVAAAPSQAPSAGSPSDSTPSQTAKPAAPAVPAEYQSALNKAQSYSDDQYMSKAALYKQLTSKYGEQFSKKAAKYAIAHVKADYDANALEKAKSYQEQQSMSPAAIHDQLTSSYGEQFTESQADYAIKHLND